MSQAKEMIALCVSSTAGAVAVLLATPLAGEGEIIHLRMTPLPSSFYNTDERPEITEMRGSIPVERSLFEQRPGNFSVTPQVDVVGHIVKLEKPANLYYDFIDSADIDDITSIILLKPTEQSSTLNSEMEVKKTFISLFQDEDGLDAPNLASLVSVVRGKLNDAMNDLNNFEEAVKKANFCPKSPQNYLFYRDEETQMLTLASHGSGETVDIEGLAHAMVSVARQNVQKWIDGNCLQSRRAQLLRELKSIDEELEKNPSPLIKIS